MRRIVILAAVLALAFAATTGAAARLPLRPASLSAGSAAVGSCDMDGITVSYHLAWRGHFVIDQVIVGGIDPACAGRSVRAVLVADGTSILLDPVVVGAGTGDRTVTIPVNADVWARKAQDVHLVIS